MMEIKINDAKDDIRATMNLLYAVMRFISMLLDLAPDNQQAQETLVGTASSLFQQCAVLFHDISAYAETFSSEGIQGSPAEIERW